MQVLCELDCALKIQSHVNPFACIHLKHVKRIKQFADLAVEHETLNRLPFVGFLLPTVICKFIQLVSYIMTFTNLLLRTSKSN